MAINLENISVEPAELSTHLCPCCGGESQTVHGYLFDETGATVVYFAGYTSGHTERQANMALSIGGWGEGTTPNDREVVVVHVRSDNNGLFFEFPPPETSPWYEESFLGRILDPNRLSDEERRHYQELSKIVAQNDSRLAGFLQQERSFT